MARIGGDEFGILLDHADEASAHETAARLVDQIAGCEFCYEGDVPAAERRDRRRA